MKSKDEDEEVEIEEPSHDGAAIRNDGNSTEVEMVKITEEEPVEEEEEEEEEEATAADATEDNAEAAMPSTPLPLLVLPHAPFVTTNLPRT